MRNNATSLSQRDAASNTIKQLRFVPGLKRCNRVADYHGGKTFLVVVLRSNREGVTSSIPITPTIQSFQTADRQVGSKEAFSVGIFAGFIPLFRSLVTLADSPADFSLPSLHPKIPFPAAGFPRPIPLRQPGILGVLGGRKRRFEPGP